ncbi:hypothetical protein CRG98_043909 [Punica granatum]|uniref:Chlorophyll a-b binding protein, chloroplastic n=1 Tax=Punica granatum TaxID=22663 RepID=A0A2I0HVM4_PUNGR|nr:hypothetical protein CRG98_043909 [Punica granatum]
MAPLQLSSNLSSSFSGLSLFHISPQPPRSLRRRASVCRAAWQELAGVLVFSAIPFTAVKAIANSPLGESLQRRLEERKSFAAENAARFKAMSEKARKESYWYGEERPQWLGPIPYDYPEYLTGEYPGDYGFDIAGLAKDPVAFEKYFKYVVVGFLSYCSYSPYKCVVAIKGFSISF